MNTITRINQIGYYLGCTSIIFLAASVPTSMAGQNIAAGTGLFAAMLYLWPLSAKKIPSTPATFSLLLMLVLVLFSIPFSLFPDKALEKLPEIELWLIFVLFLPVVFIRTEKMFRAVLMVLFIAAVAAALFSMIQYGLYHNHTAPGDTVGFRPSGFFSFYLTFGNIMGMVVVVLWGIAISGPPRKQTITAGVCALILFVGIILSKSRGPLLASVISVGTISVLRSRKTFLLFAGLAVPVIAAAYMDPSLGRRITSLFEFSEYTNFETHYAIADRLTRWQIALNMIKEHPILGVGYGLYQTSMPFFQTTGREVFPCHAHSIYMNVAAESGIPSCLCMVTAFYLFFRKFYLDYRRYANPLGLCFVGLVLHYIIAGLTEEVWSDAESFNAFWFLAGLGIACANLRNRIPSEPDEKSTPVPN